MKKQLPYIVILVAVAATVYLAAAFIAADLNPKKWDYVGRAICVAMIFPATIIGFTIYNSIKNRNQ
jgi:NO-binding membrane sensor protein with MHYT domain